MSDAKKVYLCMSCSFEDQAGVFGKGVVCPRCRSTEIVLAAIWHKFKRPGTPRPAVPPLEADAVGRER